MKKRNSAIELLRVICMVLIIFHHYSVHGLWVPEGVIFSYIEFSWHYLFVQIIGMGGRLACVVFMLITGYYTILSKVDYKKILCLIIEMFFYSWSINAVVYGLELQPFNVKDFVKGLFPVFWDNWYCVAYIGFCVLIPYINLFLNSLTKKLYIRLILILLIMWSVIPTFIIKSPYLYSNIDAFFVVYALGGYIRKYGITDVKKYIRSWHRSLWGATILMFSSVFIIDCVGIWLKSDLIFNKAQYLMEMNKLPALCAAVSMFMIAIESKEFYNPIINKLASSIIGIYLIHDNVLLRKLIWGVWSPNAGYLNSNWIVAHAVVKVVVVFFVCFCIDQVRYLLIEKRLVKWMDGHWCGWRRKLEAIMDKRF